MSIAVDEFQKVYFMTQLKNGKKSIPKGGVLTFETFRKSAPLFETDWRFYGQQNLWVRPCIKS